MLLKVNKEKSALLTDIEDFIVGYRAKQWVKDHIHLYDEYNSDDDGLFKEIIKDFFEAQPEHYSLLSTPKGIYVTCYDIRFGIIKGNSILIFRDYEETVNNFCHLANELLKDNYSYKNYKGKIDFSVLDHMIKQYKIDLKIILGDKNNGN